MTNSDVILVRTTTSGKKNPKAIIFVAVKAAVQNKDFATFAVVHKAKDDADAVQFVKTVYPNLK